MVSNSLIYNSTESEDGLSKSTQIEDRSYLNRLLIAHSLSKTYYLSIQQDYFFKNSYKKIETEEVFKRSNNSLLADPVITIIKRFARDNKFEPLLDFTLSISPKTGDFSSPTQTQKGNKRKGGTDLEASFRYGLEEAKFNATGEFFLTFHGTRKGLANDSKRLIYGPYSSYGLKVNLQYLTLDWLAVNLAGTVQRESSLKFNQEFPRHLEQKGFTAGYKIGVFLIYNPRINFFVDYNAASSSLLSSSNNIEREISEITLGAKFRF